jgi:hypothetical protein
MASYVAGITDMNLHAQLTDCASQTFCLGWPGNMVLSIFMFQVVRITCMSHYTWLTYLELRFLYLSFSRALETGFGI